MRQPAHRIFIALLTVLFFALPLTLLGQDAQGKAAALLADARKALGGDEKLLAVKTLQAKGEFQRSLGGNQITGDLEVLLEVPNKLRRNEELSLAGGGPTISRTEALSGNDVWEDNSGGPGIFIAGPGGRGGFGRGGGFGGRRGDAGAGGAGADPNQGGRGLDPERLKEAQLRALRADLAQLMLAWLLQTDQPTTWVGTAEAPDGRADVLEVKPADRTPMRLFLDSTSHLPLMITWQGAAPRMFIARRGGPGRDGPPPADPVQTPPPDAPAPPAQATFQLHLSDYRVVNGIKFPHMITRAMNGQTNEEFKVSSYKINPTFKSNTFTK